MNDKGLPAAGGGRIGSDVHPRRRIFTNRNLRLEAIRAIGFDMDHTLAVYNTVEFDRLCFELAIARLIEDNGYPRQIEDVVWDPAAAVRGLVVDKREGNLLKIDAFNYVTRVRHGSTFLDKEVKKELYPRGRVRLSGNRYRVFDTLFDLPEGSLYTALVDLTDDADHPLDVSYKKLYNDIRNAVDTLHADGTLKSRIIADLDRYFIRDDRLVATLEKFRGAGKKLFLLTNSEVEYTAAVMNHLLGGEAGSWEEIFDLVVCRAGKPGFFLRSGPGRAVQPDREPLMPNGRGHCFSGGDCFWLERCLGASGDDILYFGDHTFGDILRSKKSVGWRTAMIVPEVEEEVQALESLREPWRDLARLEVQLDEHMLERDHQQERLATADLDDQERRVLTDRVTELDRVVAEFLGRRARLQRTLRAGWNPHWESIFREGRAASRFGRQIMEFACVYTSRVSNFLRYPTNKFFARPIEVLPHERWVEFEL